MSLCLDFSEELSKIKSVAEEIGVEVMTTTKYHAEYASEGDEYGLGYLKAITERSSQKIRRRKIISLKM